MDDYREVEPMTDVQATRADILARLDELCRIEESTTNREVLEYIAARKMALRSELDNL